MTGVPGGVRVPWAQAPAEFADRLAARFGSPIAGARDHPSGFSPATAATLTLADGRRVFVKVVRSVPNRTSMSIYRKEADALALLDGSGLAPRLLWRAEGLEPGDVSWLGLVIEHVDGRHPALPWQADELGAVLDAIAALGAVRAADVGARLPDSIPRLQRLFGFWASETARSPEDRVSAGWSSDTWLADNLPALAAAEAGWRDAARGDRLVHGDLRSDNLLLHAPGAGSRRVTFLDWPYVGFGAGWLDLVLMLPSMAVEGGVDAEGIVRTHPLTRGVPAADIDAIIAAMLGYFVQQSALPAPPGLPTLRAFQRVQGEAAHSWLARRWG